MNSKRWMAVACLGAACGMAMGLAQQSRGQKGANEKTIAPHCPCDSHPPLAATTRRAVPYANEPADMRPYAMFVKPYAQNYAETTIFNGPGREAAPPKNLKEVRIGFFGPVAAQDPDFVFGQRMLHGAELAVEEANARGGYAGKPFRLMLHDDYNNWQAKATAGDVRPTESAIWGAASDQTAKMIYDDKDWAIFGAINSESTHIALRVALKAEIPIVNSASTDPTIPETSIPWFFTDVQDDRVQGYTLARRMYSELHLRRVAILRVSNRYGRFGVVKFRMASQRLGHPVVVEQIFQPGDTDFTRELEIIRESRADAVVLWCDEVPAGEILKQMRAAGMKQPVFGSYRTLGAEMLRVAGPAAEGFEAVFPYDPTQKDARWIAFNQRYEARFGSEPEQFAALAYDAMTILLDSICKAGLNRIRIQDALDDVRQFDGVTGRMVFDPNEKNVSPMFLGTVHGGAITYRRATMAREADIAAGKAALSEQQPYARPYAQLDARQVGYYGPARPDVPDGPLRVVLFGEDAEHVAQTEAMRTALNAGRGRGWELVAVNSGQNWGAASTQLVRALSGERALAIVAIGDKEAHLATQLALKWFVPVIALSEDRTITGINIPWIFRLPRETVPSDALHMIEEAEARGGANPQKLRNVLASGRVIDGRAFLANGALREIR